MGLLTLTEQTVVPPRDPGCNDPIVLVDVMVSPYQRNTPNTYVWEGTTTAFETNAIKSCRRKPASVHTCKRRWMSLESLATRWHVIVLSCKLCQFSQCKVRAVPTIKSNSKYNLGSVLAWNPSLWQHQPAGSLGGFKRLQQMHVAT